MGNIEARRAHEEWLGEGVVDDRRLRALMERAKSIDGDNMYLSVNEAIEVLRLIAEEKGAPWGRYQEVRARSACTTHSLTYEQFKQLFIDNVPASVPLSRSLRVRVAPPAAAERPRAQQQMWQCLACTFMNEDDVAECDVCGVARGERADVTPLQRVERLVQRFVELGFDRHQIDAAVADQENLDDVTAESIARIIQQDGQEEADDELIEFDQLAERFPAHPVEEVLVAMAKLKQQGVEATDENVLQQVVKLWKAEAQEDLKLSARTPTSGAEDAVVEPPCCVVCLDRAINVLFLPCKHLSTCPECSAQLSECPMCRASIVSKIEGVHLTT